MRVYSAIVRITIILLFLFLLIHLPYQNLMNGESVYTGNFFRTYDANQENTMRPKASYGTSIESEMVLSLLQRYNMNGHSVFTKRITQAIRNNYFSERFGDDIMLENIEESGQEHFYVRVHNIEIDRKNEILNVKISYIKKVNTDIVTISETIRVSFVQRSNQTIQQVIDDIVREKIHELAQNKELVIDSAKILTFKGRSGRKHRIIYQPSRTIAFEKEIQKFQNVLGIPSLNIEIAEDEFSVYGWMEYEEHVDVSNIAYMTYEMNDMQIEQLGKICALGFLFNNPGITEDSFLIGIDGAVMLTNHKTDLNVREINLRKFLRQKLLSFKLDEKKRAIFLHAFFDLLIEISRDSQSFITLLQSLRKGLYQKNSYRNKETYSYDERMNGIIPVYEETVSIERLEKTLRRNLEYFQTIINKIDVIIADVEEDLIAAHGRIDDIENGFKIDLDKLHKDQIVCTRSSHNERMEPRVLKIMSWKDISDEQIRKFGNQLVEWGDVYGEEQSWVKRTGMLLSFDPPQMTANTYFAVSEEGTLEGFFRLNGNNFERIVIAPKNRSGNRYLGLGSELIAVAFKKIVTAGYKNARVINPSKRMLEILGISTDTRDSASEIYVFSSDIIDLFLQRQKNRVRSILNVSQTMGDLSFLHMDGAKGFYQLLFSREYRRIADIFKDNSDRTIVFSELGSDLRTVKSSLYYLRDHPEVLIVNDNLVNTIIDLMFESNSQDARFHASEVIAAYIQQCVKIGIEGKAGNALDRIIKRKNISEFNYGQMTILRNVFNTGSEAVEKKLSENFPQAIHSVLKISPKDPDSIIKVKISIKNILENPPDNDERKALKMVVDLLEHSSKVLGDNILGSSELKGYLDQILRQYRNPLKARNWKVRVLALASIGINSDLDNFDIVLQIIMNDREEEVQYRARNALQNILLRQDEAIREKKVTELIEKLNYLEENEMRFLSGAIRNVIKTLPGPAISGLLNRIMSIAINHKTAYTRLKALKLLANLIPVVQKNEAGLIVEILISALSDNEIRVREEALISLWKRVPSYIISIDQYAKIMQDVMGKRDIDDSYEKIIALSFNKIANELVAQKQSGIISADIEMDNTALTASVMGATAPYSSSLDEETYEHFKNVVNFLSQRDKLPEKADLIMILATKNTHAAVEAARLYRKGICKRIVVCGGFHALGDQRPEAKIYSEILLQEGVLQEDIIIEDQSTDTQKNIQFGMQLAKRKWGNLEKVILIQHPLLQRRAGATFQRWITDKNIILYNHAAYLPEIKNMSNAEQTVTMRIALGEIGRLRRYGTDGLGYIVDVPFSKELGWSIHQVHKSVKTQDDDLESLSLIPLGPGYEDVFTSEKAEKTEERFSDKEEILTLEEILERAFDASDHEFVVFSKNNAPWFRTLLNAVKNYYRQNPAIKSLIERTTFKMVCRNDDPIGATPFFMLFKGKTSFQIGYVGKFKSEYVAFEPFAALFQAYNSLLISLDKINVSRIGPLAELLRYHAEILDMQSKGKGIRHDTKRVARILAAFQKEYGIDISNLFAKDLLKNRKYNFTGRKKASTMVEKAA